MADALRATAAMSFNLFIGNLGLESGAMAGAVRPLDQTDGVNRAVVGMHKPSGGGAP